ncbi:hypothetical protein C4J81_02115 [Deltaproteobacteria bacterium Smac51]|nr:hypothetical protein C4J81_02115 [Deltaproteobacteria bacterium Smac51]
MIRIAIVDDDKEFLRQTIAHVEAYPDWGGEQHVIIPFGSAEEFWPAFECGSFDIVLLDIVMPGLSGLDVAKKIYDQDPAVIIAFVSSSPDHAPFGYGVDAVGYLLKPVEDLAVHALIYEALNRRRQRSQQHNILLKSGRTTTKINLNDVIYLESDNKRVFFHSQNENSAHSGKLADFLTQLPPNFIQVHKSYVVNLNHVSAMRPGEMITVNGRAIPISRSFRALASKLYLAHVADEV